MLRFEVRGVECKSLGPNPSNACAPLSDSKLVAPPPPPGPPERDALVYDDKQVYKIIERAQ